ncbi:helix-turn-helix domain-containing protein [Streptomyces sp. 796.1]|uniref:helix-turn-helix domain-containing protein n=1 Tax=Streptomyces sp. 796.1 TaxID=3163029 RepID=UPI0039C8FF2D
MAALNVGNLGEFLREQRRTAQLSLRQLADAAGVSNPYLSQIERGLRKPSAEILQQLAKALRISAETLYVQAGILDARDRAEAEVTSAILTDPTLTERQKQVLLQIYESFRKENGIGPEQPTAASGPGRPAGYEGSAAAAGGGAPAGGAAPPAAPYAAPAPGRTPDVAPGGGIAGATDRGPQPRVDPPSDPGAGPGPTAAGDGNRAPDPAPYDASADAAAGPPRPAPPAHGDAGASRDADASGARGSHDAQ